MMVYLLDLNRLQGSHCKSFDSKTGEKVVAARREGGIGSSVNAMNLDREGAVKSTIQTHVWVGLESFSTVSTGDRYLCKKIVVLDEL